MKGSKFLQEFKAFALKGNVMDLAVGVIIGGAFGKIVSSLVADVIMPLLGLLIGGINFTDLHFTLKAAKEVVGVLEPAVLLNYGKFLQSAFDFLVIAFSIFLFIRLLSKLQTKKDKEAAAAPAPEPPAPSKEEQLLTEIRDLLSESAKK